MKNIILIVTLVLFGASAGLAQQKMYEPKRDSPERKSLIDAVRDYDVALNDDFAGEIFEVNALRVQGSWAFASLSRTNLPEAGQGTGLAFLQRTGKTWKVMWSDNNDNQEVGVAAITRLRKKHKDFGKELASFAENGFLAG